MYACTINFLTTDDPPPDAIISSYDEVLPEMVAAIKIREHLCSKIAALDDQCALDNVSRQLEPILEAALDSDDQLQIGTPVHGVSPLMVACDKAQVACIEWILSKITENESLISLLGSPLDHADAGNTAIHYAAHSCCHQAIPLLCSMLHEKDTAPATKLGSMRNDNFDTPIMIAAVRGHVAFLRETLRLAEKEADSRDSTKLFQLVNDDGDAALSLACGHGRVGVVNFLLQEANVTVTYDIVKEAQERLNKIDVALAQVTKTPEHKARRNDAYKCLVILKVSLAKLTEATMEELLAEEDERDANTKPREKGKKKKSKQVSEDRDKDIAANGDTDVNNGTDGDVMEDKDHWIDRTSVSSAGDAEQQRFGASEDSASPEARRLPTNLPESQGTSDFGTDLDVDAIIEALCLDSSMLLLNSNDMAASLSPCQLDAVAAVLRNQIQAVKEARTIQLHLRNQATENGVEKSPKL